MTDNMPDEFVFVRTRYNYGSFVVSSEPGYKNGSFIGNKLPVLLKKGYQWQPFCGVVQASEVSSPNCHKVAIKPFIGFKLSSNEIAGEWQDYCFHTRALGVIDENGAWLCLDCEDNPITWCAINYTV